ncbi:MAG: prepilin-type N-terminal cleavage/methylation domain-containing protein [Candidatus Izemoplasmataceae bacterium]
MKNNKGVTLVELLVVIVVMGIIAGFAIPAVGGIITNAEKDAVLNDAIQIENAARLYCSSSQDPDFCSTGGSGNSKNVLTDTDLSTLLEGLGTHTTATVYRADATAVTDLGVALGDWVVELSGGDYDFGPGVPSESTRADIS